MRERERETTERETVREKQRERERDRERDCDGVRRAHQPRRCFSLSLSLAVSLCPTLCLFRSLSLSRNLCHALSLSRTRSLYLYVCRLSLSGKVAAQFSASTFCVSPCNLKATVSVIMLVLSSPTFVAWGRFCVQLGPVVEAGPSGKSTFIKSIRLETYLRDLWWLAGKAARNLGLGPLRPTAILSPYGLP